jgi:Family of unknown function (DUF5681)
MRRRSDRAQDYRVGYGRPPRQHQFKPGRSGNPKGRPKGAKNEETILNNLLNRKIEIREAGRARKVTVLEAVFLRFTEAALKGDAKAATFLLNRYRQPDADEPSINELTQEDREILDAFTRRVQAQLKEKL